MRCDVGAEGKRPGVDDSCLVWVLRVLAFKFSADIRRSHVSRCIGIHMPGLESLQRESAIAKSVGAHFIAK